MAPRVMVKSSVDRRYVVWQVVRGAPAINHPRRRHDWKVNPKGILRLMCEDNLLCVRRSCSCPVIREAHDGEGSAGRWTAKERLANTPFREKPIGTVGPHEIASELAI
jgi:hypothetical protein